MYDEWRVSLYMVMPQNIMQYSGGVLHEIPVSVIKFLLNETISNVPGNIPSQ